MAKTIQILMVDDDVDDQLLFLNAVNEIDTSSVKCETAGNGLEALKKLEIPPPPDVIFLDLNMPVMNGFECLSKIKMEDKYKDIPVVIFTTANDKASIDHARKLGASAFFHKPIDFSILQHKLNQVVHFISGTDTSSDLNESFVI